MRVLIECAIQGAVVAAGLSALWRGYVAVGSKVRTDGKGLPVARRGGANSVGSQG